MPPNLFVQRTTSALHSVFTRATMSRVCWEKATKIHLIWKSSTCTTELNTTLLSPVCNIATPLQAVTYPPLHQGLDRALQPNQAVPHLPFIEELLSFATGKDAAGNPLLTARDLSRILGKRRAESKAMNKEYNLQFSHRLFGSAKCVIFVCTSLSLMSKCPSLKLCSASAILTIFGGRVDDLGALLSEERLPQGWESRIRKPYGLTFFSLNSTILRVEFGVREADWAVDTKRAVGSQQPVEVDA